MARSSRMLLPTAALACAVSSVGCTRVNPAFKDGAVAESGDSLSTTDASGETGSSSSSSTTASSSTTTDTASTDTASTDTDPTDTDPTDTDPTDTDPTDTSSTDTGTEPCELGYSNGLTFKFFSEAAANGCPGEVLGDFVIRGASVGGGIIVDPCGPNCEGCTNTGAEEIEVFPADLTLLAETGVGACVRAQFSQLGIEAADYCGYQKFMLSGLETEPVPLVIGSAGDGAPPSFAANALGGFSPSIVADESCTCDGSDPCCEASAPPTLFAFDIGELDLLFVGEEATVDLLSGVFDFFAVQAQRKLECNAKLEVSWLMVVTGL